MASDRCPDCSDSTGSFDPRPAVAVQNGRRSFLRTAAAGAAALALSPSLLRAEDKPTQADAETLVQQLYGSLKEEQKKEVCFAYDDPLRLKVDNNWHIVKKTIADFYTKDQQSLIKEIFMKLHNPEYAQRVYDQVDHDSEDIGGFNACAVALFGTPALSSKAGQAGESKFEFVFTGRHVTRRCDGNSVEGAAFGGPIFYGHASKSFNEKADHAGNIYWYQGLRANDVYKALSGKQQELALRTDARPERGTETVKLAGKTGVKHGVPLSELSSDQKDLVRKVLADVLAPFRKADADEAMKHIDAAGIDQLHMAFYKNMDIGNDGVWDVWQLEGPNSLWYFRGAPHVHTWVNIREPEKA